MSMSKRDYNEIAAVLKTRYEDEKEKFFSYRTEDCGHITVQRVAEELADLFAAGNPRFDKQIFMVAVVGEGGLIQ